MSIPSTRQLENTRKKLQMLEGRLQDLDAEPVVNPQTRELTKRSLTKLVNRLKEEIARFESLRLGPVAEELRPVRKSPTSTTPQATTPVNNQGWCPGTPGTRQQLMMVSAKPARRSWCHCTPNVAGLFLPCLWIQAGERPGETCDGRERNSTGVPNPFGVLIFRSKQQECGF